MTSQRLWPHGNGTIRPFPLEFWIASRGLRKLNWNTERHPIQTWDDSNHRNIWVLNMSNPDEIRCVVVSSTGKLALGATERLVQADNFLLSATQKRGRHWTTPWSGDKNSPLRGQKCKKATVLHAKVSSLPLRHKIFSLQFTPIKMVHQIDFIHWFSFLFHGPLVETLSKDSKVTQLSNLCCGVGVRMFFHKFPNQGGCRGHVNWNVGTADNKDTRVGNVQN